MQAGGNPVYAKVHEADIAISALLHSPDAQKQNEANRWLTELFELSIVWNVALYVAFPPSELSRNGTWPSVEVRFFALNMLLSKLRSDTPQLPSQYCQQVHEMLLAQLLTVPAGMLRSRLCLAIAASAARIGVEACHQLVSMAMGDPMGTGEVGMETPVALELLTALAEETLLRFRSQTWEVHECLEECMSLVVPFLEQLSVAAASSNDTQLMHTLFLTLNRWKHGGLTLSELYTQYPRLYAALLSSLAAPDRGLFEAASAALVEFISEVDMLPGRDDAIQATLAGIVKQEADYVDGAAYRVGGSPDAEARAQGLVSLVTAVVVAEPNYIARDGPSAMAALKWILDATAAGAKGRLDWACMASEVWPRLASVSRARRSPSIQPPLFSAATQAVLQSASFQGESDGDDDELLADERLRFREGPGSDALTACYSELHNDFLINISAHIQGASSWQALEVGLYAVRAVGERLLAVVQGKEGGVVKPVGKPALIVGPEEPATATSFLRTLLLALPGAPAVTATDKSGSPEVAVLEGCLQLVEVFAAWAASDLAVLEATLRYALGSLLILPEKRHAALAMRALCDAAASDLAAAHTLGWMMSAYAEADANDALDIDDRVAITQGLATVAAVLSPEDAQSALHQLAAPALSLLNNATIQEPWMADASCVEDGLRLLACIVSCGGATKWAQQGVPHPLLPLLQGCWSRTEAVVGVWAENGGVAASVCELWAAIAGEVGAALDPVLPQVIASATRMFATTYHPSCLSCLQKIVEMPQEGARASADVATCLATCLQQLAACIPSLERLLNQLSHPTPIGKREGRRKSGVGEKQGKAKSEPSEALGGMCELGRSFLCSQPSLLFSSPAFLQLCHCAVVGVRWKEVDSSLSAILFLSDVLGWYREPPHAPQGRGGADMSLEGHTDKDAAIVGGQQAVNTAIGFLGAILVEEILKGLGSGEFGERLAEAMGSVLYALIHSFHSATEAAMLSTLRLPDFPAKTGSIIEADKRRFVTAATRQPMMPLRTFLELMSDFSQVCQGLSPADILGHY